MTIKKQAFTRGIILKADDVAFDGISGELKASLTTQRLQTYLDGAAREVITADQSQTLTNKTLNLDNNTLSNFEVDNLKSGVLNTSTALTGASDTQIPSALAVKTFAEDIAASEAGAVQTNLDNHVNDTTDAHDASAISSVPSGNLAATDVQAALDELQSDVDTRATATALTDHINDTTDAHDASAISNVAAGNLAATDVQGALNELQGDIDTINTTSLPAKVTGPASSVDSEIVLFDSTTGKLVKRATGSGFVKATSGVYSTSAAVNAATELTGVVPLANGGTNKNITPVAGALLWTDADSVELTAAGTTGQYLISNGTSAPTWSSVVPGNLQVATISDVKASGNAGGTFTSGAFQTRTLNTLSDPASIVTSLTANQFTLPAGTYYIDAFAPAVNVNGNKLKLRNITDSSDALIGTSSYANATGGVPAESLAFLRGEITIAGSKTFELQHRCTTTFAASGFGVASSFSVSEVYAVVKITKVS